MSLSFTQLLAFHAAAEAGGVARGATRLDVSQPAVSKQIRQLERTLDVKLFERTSRGAKPTAAGELLASYTRRIFALADEAEAAVADLRGLRRGRLAVGASPTIGTYFLPHVVVRFRRRFPGVAVGLEIADAATLQQKLADGLLDFALSEVPPQRPEIESTVIHRDRLIAIAPPNHPLARRRSITLARLCEESFIVRETGSQTKSLVERALASKGFTLTPALTLGSTEAIKCAVAAGLGVAIVSSLAAAPELRSRQLARLNVTGLSIAREVNHLRVRGRRESKAAHAMMCLVRHHAAGRLR